MNNVMVDLETMGNGPCAAIVAIGAVEFEPDSGKLGRVFYQEINLEDSVANGGVIDASTVLWWMQQGDVARAAVYSKDGINLLPALLQFAQWLRECGPGVKVWGNGSPFDNVILRSAYSALHMDAPWEFWNDRCYRTLKNLRPDIGFARGGTHHNALDDAITQARHAVAILSALYQGDQRQPLVAGVLEEAEEFINRHSEPWYLSGQALLSKVRHALSLYNPKKENQQ